MGQNTDSSVEIPKPLKKLKFLKTLGQWKNKPFKCLIGFRSQVKKPKQNREKSKPQAKKNRVKTKQSGFDPFK